MPPQTDIRRVTGASSVTTISSRGLTAEIWLLPTGEIADATGGPRAFLDDLLQSGVQTLQFVFGALPRVSALQSVGVFALLFAGRIMVLKGKTKIGIVVAFISGLDRVLDPWRELIAFVQSTSVARVKFDLIEATLGKDLVTTSIVPTAVGRRSTSWQDPLPACSPGRPGHTPYRVGKPVPRPAVAGGPL